LAANGDNLMHRAVRRRAWDLVWHGALRGRCGRPFPQATGLCALVGERHQRDRRNSVRTLPW